MGTPGQTATKVQEHVWIDSPDPMFGDGVGLSAFASVCDKASSTWHCTFDNVAIDRESSVLSLRAVLLRSYGIYCERPA